MTVEDDQESEKDRGEASAQSMLPSAPPSCFARCASQDEQATY